MNGESKDRPFDINDDTRKGLQYMMFGFFFLTLHNFIGGAFVFMFINFSSKHVGEKAFFGTCCMLSLSRIVFIILFIVGFAKIYLTAGDISKKHKKNIKISLILIITVIILYVLQALLYLSVFLLWRLVHLFGPEFLFYSPLILIANISFSVAPVFLILDITNKDIKKASYVNAAMLIFLNSLLYLYFNHLAMVYTFYQFFDTVFIYVAISLIFSGLGYLIYAFCYLMTIRLYRVKVERRLEIAKRMVVDIPEKIDVKPEIKKCFKCHKISVEVYPDGSGYCVDCNHSYMDYRSAENPVEG